MPLKMTLLLAPACFAAVCTVVVMVSLSIVRSESPQVCLRPSSPDHQEDEAQGMPGSQATRAVHLSDGEDADGGLGQSVRSTNNATGNRARARRGPVSNADHDAGNDRAEDELDSDDDDDLPSIAAYGQPSVGSKGRHARDSGNASTSAGPSTSRRTSRVTGGVGGAGDARDDGSGSAAGNLARASISPKKKRQKISADELEEIRRRQALEQQQDDFFTNKRSLVFVEKGKQITKRGELHD